MAILVSNGMKTFHPHPSIQHQTLPVLDISSHHHQINGWSSKWPWTINGHYRLEGVTVPDWHRANEIVGTLYYPHPRLSSLYGGNIVVHNLYIFLIELISWKIKSFPKEQKLLTFDWLVLSHKNDPFSIFWKVMSQKPLDLHRCKFALILFRH